MSVLTASYYDASFLGSTASSGATLYMRSAANQLDASKDNAMDLGTLKTNETQLDVQGSLSKFSGTHFYKFKLDGTNMKAALFNYVQTANITMQVMDSSGKVIADSNGTAEQLEAYGDLTSYKGLNAKAGEYTVKVAFAPGSLRSTAQIYEMSFYSGSTFRSAYKTTTSNQTMSSQKVLVDPTMVFSTSDAEQYSTQGVHYANEEAASGVNIGWLYENKTALKVTSQLTATCDEQFYNVTLQKGDNLKMALNNRTQTATMRVQIYDSTGYRVLADSEGTAAQKEAYEKLTSSEGMEAKKGAYVIKISYARGQAKTKPQNYDFKLYSGEHYSKIYQSQVATESAGTAIMSGHLTPAYNMNSVAASYLYSMSQGGGAPDIMTVLQNV